MKVCVDSTDPQRAGRFWADLLDLELRSYDDGECGVFEPDSTCVLWLNKVDTAKTVKHRVHLDVCTSSVAGLVALGAATRVPAGDDRAWTVMVDQEGGEFCAFLLSDLPVRRLHGLVVDSADAASQARWWARVFNATVVDDEDGFSTVQNVPGMPILTMNFCPVPEPKTGKNRIHWDVAVPDLEPLLDAGAAFVQPRHGAVEWDVLSDPEGNEFCVFTRPA